MVFTIRQYRKGKSWTQERLAKESNVSRVTISRMESGKLTTTSIDTIMRLAKALDVTMDDLIAH